MTAWPALAWTDFAAAAWPAFAGMPYASQAPAGPLRSAALGLSAGGVELSSLGAIGTIDGVVIGRIAGRNGPGTGRISIGPAGLSWCPPGMQYGPSVPVAGDGSYLLCGSDSDRWIVVQVYASWLLPSAEAEVLLHDRYGNGIAAADATADQAAAGNVATWSLIVANYGAKTLRHLRAWLDAATVGHALSADGVTYLAATATAPLALGDLASGGTITLYLQRTIAAAAPSDPKLLNSLHFSWAEPIWE
jgi:hypothetical protein